MGNYSGTTRCGYCGQRGHNKAGCPKLKARVEELRKTDPDSYLVQRWDAKAEKRSKRATGKRVCAYCAAHRKTIDSWDWRKMDDAERAASGCVESTTKDRWGHTEAIGVERDTLYNTDGERGVGHSIRACKYHKRDLAAYQEVVAANRVRHFDRMIATGFGPGATLVFEEGVQVQRQHPTPGAFVITEMRWSGIGFPRMVITGEAGNQTKVSDEDHRYVDMEVAQATHVAHLFSPNPPYGMRQMVTFPQADLDHDPQSDSYRSSYTARVESILRPTSEEKIRNAVPFGWATGTDDATVEKINDALMREVKTRSKKKN